MGLDLLLHPYGCSSCCRVDLLRHLSLQFDHHCHSIEEDCGRAGSLSAPSLLRDDILHGVRVLHRLRHQQCSQCQHHHRWILPILSMPIGDGSNSSRPMRIKQWRVQLPIGHFERICTVVPRSSSVLQLPFMAAPQALVYSGQGHPQGLYGPQG